jgi:hypothetical protein
MTKDEWRQLLEDIYRSEIATALQRYLTERKKQHPVTRERIDSAGRKLVRALQAARFLDSYFDDGQCLEHSIKKEFFIHLYDDLEFGLKINHEAVERSGISDIIQHHLLDIASMLELEDLPDEDLQVLRDSGSTTPESELRICIKRLHRLAETVESSKNDTKVSFCSSVSEAKNIISERRRSLEKSPNNAIISKKDVTKGLVDTCRGACLCLSNTSLLVMSWPISPLASVSSAIPSIATGISDIVYGVRELRRK